ncbi:DUF2335 domain-containing protein [Salinicoccus sp. CNSTN-B1]
MDRHQEETETSEVDRTRKGLNEGDPKTDGDQEATDNKKSHSDNEQQEIDINEAEENVEGILEKLPRGQAKHIVERMSISKSGPLPDPEDFARYEEIMTGAADRIMSMAEKEQSHRHEIGKTETEKYYDNNYKLTRFSMFTGVVISFLGSTSGVLISIYGQSTAGIILASAAILPVVLTAIKDLFRKEVTPSNNEHSDNQE